MQIPKGQSDVGAHEKLEKNLCSYLRRQPILRWFASLFHSPTPPKGIICFELSFKIQINGKSE